MKNHLFYISKLPKTKAYKVYRTIQPKFLKMCGWVSKISHAVKKWKNVRLCSVDNQKITKKQYRKKAKIIFKKRYWAQSTYIYRVPQCMSPRRNWDSPTPPQSVASDCAPPPQAKGGRAHSPAGEGWGSPNSDDWRKSLALCLLCGTGTWTGTDYFQYEKNLYRDKDLKRKTETFLVAVPYLKKSREITTKKQVVIIDWMKIFSF
jgi:hypothetical protein